MSTEIEWNDGSKMDFDILWLQRELEFKHQPQQNQFRSNEKQALKFGELVYSLFDIRKEELSFLSIHDGSLSSIEGEDNIWNYEFLQHYKRNENGEYAYFRKGCSQLANQIVLTLAYRTYEKIKSDQDKSISKRDAILMVHLQYPEGLKDQVLYVQATFCLPTIMLERAKKGLNPQPQSFSILLALDYRPIEEIDQEFYSVYNSASEKLSSNRFSELTYLEGELMETLFYPQIAKAFYFGKKVMAEKRFWDAITYFNTVFMGLQQKWWDEQASDEEFEILIECSFLIGYCYFELGLLEKAHKFLEFSAKSGSSSYTYLSEYINCLIALHDIRSLMAIDYHLDILTTKSEIEKNEKDTRFFMFLLRRKSYCMVELKKYDEAIAILNMILENDPENQFAKQELNYIEQIKKNEQSL